MTNAPDLVKQWLGPARNEMSIERWDFRTAGGYRYRHLGPDGDQYWFNGVFRAVRDNEFVIQTFELEGAPDMVGAGCADGRSVPTPRLATLLAGA